MDHPEALPKILAFLDEAGVRVVAEPLAEDGFLPAIVIRAGVLVYDPDRLEWPGDLLHEAGHIAMTDPELLATVEYFGEEPGKIDGDEIGAMAWSYAAALAAGIDPHVVFHQHGYRGSGAWYVETFATSPLPPGLPMLQYYGLARFKDEDGDKFPAMKRWLR